MLYGLNVLTNLYFILHKWKIFMPILHARKPVKAPLYKQDTLNLSNHYVTLTYFDSYILLTTSFDCTLTKYCLQDFIFMNHLKLLIRIWIRYVINGIKYITSKNA